MSNQQPLQLGTQPKSIPSHGTPYGRGRGVTYDPNNPNPYMVSRGMIELFMQCPRCFWLAARLKIKRPSGPPFKIDSAIDELLKKEFDVHRAKNKAHPLMESYHIDAVPFAHDDLDKWRHNFTGVQYWHEATNLFVTGAIDDVWQYPNGELIVVDYKATSKKDEVSIDADWQISYKRQMEVYQWLLRQNGFVVTNTSYFVYCNGKTDKEAFDAQMEFDIKLIPYEGKDDWVEPVLLRLKECLDGDMPEIGTAAMGGPCDFCTYAKQRTEMTLKAIQKPKTA